MLCFSSPKNTTAERSRGSCLFCRTSVSDHSKHWGVTPTTFHGNRKLESPAALYELVGCDLLTAVCLHIYLHKS